MPRQNKRRAKTADSKRQSQSHQAPPDSGPLAERATSAFEQLKHPHSAQPDESKSYKGKNESRRYADGAELDGRIQRANIVFTLILSTVLVIVTFFQWIVTRQTLQESIATREIENRAYVSVDKGRLVKEVLAGEPASAHLTVVNKGNTPALRVRSWTSIGFTNAPMPDPASPLPLKDKVMSAHVVPRDGAFAIDVAGDVPVPEEGVKAFTEGKLPIYVWGTVEYEDVFGKSHMTRFCFFKQKGPGIDLHACPNNNYAN